MIFHAKKPNGFVMVDKAALNDPRISFKAKGLLCYLLSKPPDWRPQIEDICRHCTEGEKAVRSALKELAACGYAKLIHQQGDKGRWEGSFWTIHERPPSAEIAVLGDSEKGNLKELRIRVTKNKRVLSDCAPSPIEGWQEPSKEKLIQENDSLISSLLVGHIESDLVDQWKHRSIKTPWRTMHALSELMNELAAGRVIHNRGGFANKWYFNCDKRKDRRGIVVS